jgi:hypothetical protein
MSLSDLDLYKFIWIILISQDSKIFYDFKLIQFQLPQWKWIHRT